MTRQIYSVDTIDLTASGDKVRVAVQGRVNTSGWSNIRLVPAKEHADPDTIGLDLVGDEPGDVMVNDVVTPVDAATEVSPEGRKGVVVYSANDSVQQRF